MKKVVLSLVFVASVIAVSAQPRAIGVRFGYGAEFSYQHGFGDKNMLQLDAGFPAFHAIHLIGTYNWVFPISSWQHAGSWNWYVGGGAGVGLGWWWYNSSYWVLNHNSSRFYGFTGLAAMGGVEYNFKFPLQLSVDYRPLIGIRFSKNDVRFYGDGLFLSGALAVSARYRF